MYCFSHNVFPPSTYENVVLLANLFTYVQTLCLFTYFARKFTTTFLARLLAYDVRYILDAILNAVKPVLF